MLLQVDLQSQSIAQAEREVVTSPPPAGAADLQPQGRREVESLASPPLPGDAARADLHPQDRREGELLASPLPVFAADLQPQSSRDVEPLASPPPPGDANLQLQAQREEEWFGPFGPPPAKRARYHLHSSMYVSNVHTEEGLVGPSGCRGERVAAKTGRKKAKKRPGPDLEAQLRESTPTADKIPQPAHNLLSTSWEVKTNQETRKGSWECPTCLSGNPYNVAKCVCCGAYRPRLNENRDTFNFSAAPAFAYGKRKRVEKSKDPNSTDLKKAAVATSKKDKASQTPKPPVLKSGSRSQANPAKPPSTSGGLTSQTSVGAPIFGSLVKQANTGASTFGCLARKANVPTSAASGALPTQTNTPVFPFGSSVAPTPSGTQRQPSPTPMDVDVDVLTDLLYGANLGTPPTMWQRQPVLGQGLRQQATPLGQLPASFVRFRQQAGVTTPGGLYVFGASPNRSAQFNMRSSMDNAPGGRRLLKPVRRLINN